MRLIGVACSYQKPHKLTAPAFLISKLYTYKSVKVVQANWATSLVAKAIQPDYALGAHTASLGLASSLGTTLPVEFANGMFVGQHGSWNRKPFSGYKVIFVPFVDGKPVGVPVDVLTGFVSKEGNAYGRPVGLALDKTGALLVADDVGNTIWRVTANKK